ncbi:hypothetical protein ABIE13_005193 [Ottowia thiooxydans]|uniref:Uncharacterized protein n=1 Tax=Ottowia thiooxydans TaxID=219182 RepID=A0ABV2QGA5_9BURK
MSWTSSLIALEKSLPALYGRIDLAASQIGYLRTVKHALMTARPFCLRIVRTGAPLLLRSRPLSSHNCCC